jgi:hypothetical protein
MDKECAVCLIRETSEIICPNSHKTCKECIIILKHNNMNRCPICREILTTNLSINDLIEPYNSSTHKLQHRFDDCAQWEDYDDLSNRNIIANINISYVQEQYGGSLIISNNFIIYWGNQVNNSILETHPNPNYAEVLKENQKQELLNWRANYEDKIIVQRNKNHTGMRLARLAEIV